MHTYRILPSVNARTIRSATLLEGTKGGVSSPPICGGRETGSTDRGEVEGWKISSQPHRIKVTECRSVRYQAYTAEHSFVHA